MAAGMLVVGADMAGLMSDKCSKFLTSSVYPDVRKMQQTPDEAPVGFTAFIDTPSPSAVAFPCVFGHMRRRHSSHVSASPAAEASVKAARTLRAAQRAKRLDGRWSGGYFATGAEDITYAVTSYSGQGRPPTVC
jgi:hypothetical protein